MQLLEDNLRNLSIGDDFKKSFIFSCATIFAPNSKLEGVHDLCDINLDNDVVVQKNVTKFLLCTIFWRWS